MPAAEIAPPSPHDRLRLTMRPGLIDRHRRRAETPRGGRAQRVLVGSVVQSGLVCGSTEQLPILGRNREGRPRPPHRGSQQRSGTGVGESRARQLTKHIPGSPISSLCSGASRRGNALSGTDPASHVEYGLWLQHRDFVGPGRLQRASEPGCHLSVAVPGGAGLSHRAVCGRPDHHARQRPQPVCSGYWHA